MKETTSYLGFTISPDGVSSDPFKISSIRSFIPQFSEIAIPLINLTKKYAKFKWTDESQQAFNHLKQNLTRVPLLGYPDTSEPHVLYADASDKAIGACLVQEVENNNQIEPGVKNKKTIYFLSHKLSETQQRWYAVEKEAFAIHYALQKLDHYLHNATFVIKTDHKPFEYLLDSPMKNRKIQLWALGISGYNCRIEYIAGTENTCADLLSRTFHEEDVPQGKTMEEEPYISDKALEINFIDSSQINPKEYASADVELPDMPSFSKDASEFEGTCINMF